MTAKIRSQVLVELRGLGVAVADDVEDKTPLIHGGLEMESLYVMQVVTKLEARYGVGLIDDPAAMQNLTLGGLVELVAANTGPAKESASPEDIKAILVESAGSGLPADVDLDTELVIDSFTLVWLKHELDERHGIVIDPGYADLESFTSINGIHAYVSKVSAG